MPGSLGPIVRYPDRRREVPRRHRARSDSGSTHAPLRGVLSILTILPDPWVNDIEASPESPFGLEKLATSGQLLAMRIQRQSFAVPGSDG